MSPPPNTNRPIRRFITTHNADGKAVFSDAIPTDAPIREIGTGGNMTFSLMYTNASFPAQVDGSDISTYQDYLVTPPKITIPGGSVCRVCDFAPGYLTAMHRTPSLDFGVVLEGEIELVLDSGETRRLKRGDVAVQRGTNHAWRNVTPDKLVDGKMVGQWARVLYVLESANPVEVSGKRLEEDEGGIE